jgi:Kef-type K+ transport system membrane component KefB
MTGLALLLFAAAVGHAIARGLRLPLIPVLVLVGQLLASSRFAAPPEVTQPVLELGLTFLVFAAGMELHPGRFKGQRRSVVTLATVQFVVTALAGFGVARLLGLAPGPALYVSGALSTSSTLMAVRHLRQKEAVTEPLGRLVTGVLLVQDIIVVVALVILTGFPDGAVAVSANLVRMVLLLAVVLVARRWVLPWLIVGRRLDEEVLLLAVIATLFLFVGGAHHLGLPLAGGAFLAGLALARFPLNGLARGQLTSLTDFFVALFFTALAGSIEITGPAMVGQALALVGVVVLLTPPLVSVLAERAGLCTRAALESGLVLAQGSEFALILGLIGLRLGHLEPEVFSLIALVAALTMILNPLLVHERSLKWFLRWYPFRPRGDAVAGPLRGHVLMLGFGAAGMWALKPLRAAGHEVLVVDDDLAVIAGLKRRGIPCLRGDAADAGVLQRAGAAEAKLILVATRRVRDAEEVLRRVPQVPVIVRVFEAGDAERIRALGGTPVLNSLAAADAFMAWFGERWPLPQPEPGGPG